MTILRMFQTIGLCLAFAGLGQPAPALAAVGGATQAETHRLSGRWEGPLNVGGGSIRFVLRVDTSGAAAVDSPDQGVVGLAVSDLSVEGDTVSFQVPSVGGRFEGVLASDGSTLAGALHQGPAQMPLALTRVEETASAAAPARPQHPVEPYPYRVEEVVFDNPAALGVRLAGTLTLPEGEGPFPAAVLISGSGPQDRDETILGHKPFLVWADALTRRGVAVLRYDDRGMGHSTGDFLAATSADFATDTAAAVAFLQSRHEIDSGRIGLIGHSEGGLIAPMVAVEGGEVAWVVMLAGPAVSGGEILQEQQRRLAAAAGMSPEEVAAGNRIQRAVLEAVAENADDGEAAAIAVTALLVAIGMPEGQSRQSAESVSGPWYRWFVAHDPAATLQSLNVPLLAVYGGKDLQVPADQNAPVLEGLNPAAQVVVFPELNHLLQTAETGQVEEYGEIEETIAAEALTMVVDWVMARSAD
ncbi:alpha/beta hydrolase [Brevundimonas sp.]|uniref:alpha/beta hydrolase family protein n=1 Tax=Brevundimonas sp. TaxID=1871086 RepID=UPI0025D2029F|nr:alpha/beta hydrolase [Brevundimonas sp.]